MSCPRKKKHSEAPSVFSPASGLASSQVTHHLLSPTNLQSQSHLKSPQKKQQSQPVCPWSAHTLPFKQSSSPFLRNCYALSTSSTAVGELFLFGGQINASNRSSNDLYVISKRDFSITPLHTSGDIPSPRYSHCAVLNSTTLLIWGGSDVRKQNAQNQRLDDTLYLLNLVSRVWTRVVVDGPGPGGRHHHTMTLVGSKLFVFGGISTKGYFNDIWALDLNCLTSNPLWESYEPAPGNEKPLPRAAHVSVTTGDRIIIFGGCDGPQLFFNDTWSFNTSTRKWTELQCTGSIPSPRQCHAAVLIDDVMYVYGGRTADRTILGDLTAFNLSTQRWTAFQDIGPSPSGRAGHSMACDGTRVFVLGGRLSPGAQVDDVKPIHILDTKFLIHPKLDSIAVKHSEKTTHLAQKLSAGQPQQPGSSSPGSDVHADHGTSPIQKASPEELDHFAFLRITHDQTPGPNNLPSLLPGMDYRPKRILEEEDDNEGSTKHHAKLVAPDASFEKEAARLGHERIGDFKRQLSERLAERDRHISQLTNQLVQKSILLEQAEANAAEERKRAGLELRDLQAKLDELLLSRDQALYQAQSASQKATFIAAEAKERSQQELAEVHAKLEARESELAVVRLRHMDAEVGWAKSKAEADLLRASAGTQAAAGLVNMDVDRVMRRLMERVRSVEAEMASLRGNEKSIGEMECRNEG